MGKKRYATETVAASAPPSAFAEMFPDSANLDRWTGQSSGGRGTAVVSPVDLYNYLTNGGFDFIQRWPTALTTNNGGSGWAARYNQQATDRQPCFDDWMITTQTASSQVGRIDSLVTPIAGSVSRYYAQFKQITGAGKQLISHLVEYKDVANMRGKTVRIQFKLATGAWGSASAVRVGLLQNNVSATADTVAASFISAFGANTVDPTWGTNLALVAPTLVESSAVTQPTIVNSAMTIANPGASLTFTRYSMTVAVPSNCVNIILAIWTDSQMSINDVWNFAEADIHLGQSINDWMPLSTQQEEARVNRNSTKSFSKDVTPVQTAGVNTGEMKFIAGIIGALAERSPSIMLPCPMRIPIVTAHVTLFNPAAANAQVRDETAGADCSATAFVAGSDRNFAVTCTGAAGTIVGGLLGVHYFVDQMP